MYDVACRDDLVPVTTDIARICLSVSVNTVTGTLAAE